MTRSIKAIVMAVVATASLASIHETQGHETQGDQAIPPQQNAAAPVVAVPAAFDMGLCAVDQQTENRVWLVNRSNETMFIEELKGSCGCIATPGFRPTSIAPHGALPIDFSYTAPGTAGKSKTKQLRIVVRDHGTITVPLTIAAGVGADGPSQTTTEEEYASVVVPGAQSLGAVAPGVTLDASFWLINSGDVARQVTGVKGDCGCITIQAFQSTRIAPMQAVQVHYRVKSPEAPGTKKSTSIRVALSGGTVLQIPVELHTLEVVQQVAADSR